MKLPQYLSELQVKNIECRVSDKVNFLNPDEKQEIREKLFSSLKYDGVGGEPNNREQFIGNLLKRGVSQNDAQEQFEAEQLFSQVFSADSYFTYAPNMKIIFGDIKKCN